MIVLGIDPGAASGVALVQGRRGQRPLLLGCRHVAGSPWPRWLSNARRALSELGRLVDGDCYHTDDKGFALDFTGKAHPVPRIDPAKVRCVIEEPPPVATRWKDTKRGRGANTRPQLGNRLGGRLAGDQEGLRTWAGIGRRQGAWISKLDELNWPAHELIDQSIWVEGWGNIPRGKQGDGTHRIMEAGLFVEGAKEQLLAIPKTYRVDVAEAVLLAGALTLPNEWEC